MHFVPIGTGKLAREVPAPTPNATGVCAISEVRCATSESKVDVAGSASAYESPEAAGLPTRVIAVPAP
jgi:hypothetical protein